MTASKNRRAISLLLTLLGILALLSFSAGQDSKSQAGSQSSPQALQKAILLFTYIPPDSALFSEDDLQMTIPRDMVGPTAPSLAPPPGDSLPGRGRSSAPPSGLAFVEKSAFAASLVCFVGLNILDYYTTRKILQQMGPEEVNPIFRAFAKNDTAYAVFKLGYTLMSCISIMSLHDSDKPMAWALSLISNFLVSYALAYNLEQLDKGL